MKEYKINDLENKKNSDVTFQFPIFQIRNIMNKT